MYTVSERGFSDKVDDLVTHSIVTCDDKTFVAADEHVTHRKVLQATTAFILKVWGVNVITSTQKSRNFVAVSTVPVTV